MAAFEHKTPVIPQLNFKNISSKRYQILESGCLARSEALALLLLSESLTYVNSGIYPEGQKLNIKIIW